MKAEEIRKLTEKLDVFTGTTSGEMDSFMLVFMEIAAQLAEINESLKKAAAK